MLETTTQWLADLAIGLWTFPYALAVVVAGDILGEPLGAASATAVVAAAGVSAIRLLRALIRQPNVIVRLAPVPLGLALMIVGLMTLSATVGPEGLAGAW